MLRVDLWGNILMKLLHEIEGLSELQNRTVVIYDGECPFCSRYVHYQRLKEVLPNIELLNARQWPQLIMAFQKAGLPLDQGMALVLNNQLYYGAECLNRLAMLSSRIGAFNKLNALIFSSAKTSKLLYPFLREGRNLALRILRRKQLVDE